MMSGVLLLMIQCLFAQTPGRVEPTSGPEGCPMGCHAVIVFTITSVNFHKPRTNCEEGFGFCIKGKWSQNCECDYFKPVTSIENGVVKAVAKREGSKLYLYIPYALKQLDGYSNTDTNTFSVGDEMEIIDDAGKTLATLIPGDYKTKLEGDNFLVTIDLK